jgi:methionyl-tRNA formyltransferase
LTLGLFNLSTLHARDPTILTQRTEIEREYDNTKRPDVSLRLVMMGTGRFALPTFRGLYASAHEVVALYTQPDRTGRGHHRHVHPLKDAALEHQTPIFQPQNVNTPDSLAELLNLDVDLCVVAAYGQILSTDLLEIPRYGAINLHASLLPRHRGAAPVQYAILKGDSETGVTIFRIEPRLDAGPILDVVRTPIEAKETAGRLEARLAELAAPLTLHVIHQIETGTFPGVSQDSSAATRAPRIKKALGAIDWSGSAEEIERHIRAMQPWPTAFTFLEQQGRKTLRLIVLAAEPCYVDPCNAEPCDIALDDVPGRIIVTNDRRLIVRAGEGSVEIVRLRPEGKGDMTASEFLRGHAVGPHAQMRAAEAAD